MAYIDDDGGRRGPSAAVVASLIVVALIVVAALVVVVAKVAGGDRDDPRPSPTATASASSASSCGLPDGGLREISTPPRATWQLVGRLTAPFSKSAGPGETTSGVHHCFARSSEGAVVAAMFAVVDTNNASADPVVFVERRVSSTSPTYAKELARAKAGDRGETGGGYRLVGFRVDSISKTEATVTIAAQFTEGPNNGSLIAMTQAMKWEDGDWKTYLTEAGPGTSQIANLDGFVEWSGS